MIADFHFLRPYWLLALPAVWLLASWLRRRHGGEGDWTGVIAPELLPGLRLSGGSNAHALWVTPWPWLGLAWTLAVLALAGPAWQRDQASAWKAPGAWVLVLDLSPSMAVGDVAPSRVGRARYALDDLLAAARDARVALVAFADDAFAATPLTDDAATVRALLPALGPEIMPVPGDQLAPALRQAVKLLHQAGSADQRVLVVSDGIADPAAALTVAAHLRELGVRLDVVGIGPRQDALAQVAVAGGGQWVDLAGLPGFIAAMPPQAGGSARRQAGVEVAHWQDAGVWLLPPVLLLALLLARRGWL